MAEVKECDRFNKLSKKDEVGSNSFINKKIIPYEQLICMIKEYKKKEEMYNTEQITYEVLEAMAKDLIKECDNKIEKK